MKIDDELIGVFRIGSETPIHRQIEMLLSGDTIHIFTVAVFRGDDYFVKHRINARLSNDGRIIYLLNGFIIESLSLLKQTITVNLGGNYINFVNSGTFLQKLCTPLSVHDCYQSPCEMVHRDSYVTQKIDPTKLWYDLIEQHGIICFIRGDSEDLESFRQRMDTELIKASQS